MSSSEEQIVAHIAHVQERVGEERDESGSYPIIRRPVTEVKVSIHLTDREAFFLRINRKGDRRLTTLLGPALKWEFNPQRNRLNPPRVTAFHSTSSNPHRVRTTKRIAERTLQSLQELLERLKTEYETRPR